MSTVANRWTNRISTQRIVKTATHCTARHAFSCRFIDADDSPHLLLSKCFDGKNGELKEPLPELLAAANRCGALDELSTILDTVGLHCFAPRSVRTQLIATHLKKVLYVFSRAFLGEQW